MNIINWYICDILFIPMQEKKCLKPIDKNIKGISCDMQSKIDDIKLYIIDTNPHRTKVSETEAILKAIHEYHKSIKQ